MRPAPPEALLATRSAPPQALLEPASSQSPLQPHLFLLFADDWGWGNVGYHRPRDDTSGEVATPHIDALAAEGVRLERMVAYSFCAPSRASVISGRLPYHVSLANIRGTQYNPAHPEVGGAGVPRNMTTLPQRLRSLGYRCHFVGKWDVGFATAGHTPHGRGYHSSLAYFYQVNDYWTQAFVGSEAASCERNTSTPPSQYRDLWRDTGPARSENGTAYEEVLFEAELMRSLKEYESKHLLRRADGTDGTTDSTVEADEADGESETPPPLFLHYAPHLVHSPYQVPQEWLDKFAFIAQRNDTRDGLRQTYAAMVGYLDAVLGNVTGAWLCGLVRLPPPGHTGQRDAHSCSGVPEPPSLSRPFALLLDVT
jgi:arylsulfatase I/J